MAVQQLGVAPSGPYDLATKQYVDNRPSGGTSIAGDIPVFFGTTVPTYTGGAYIWYQINATGAVINVYLEDGSGIPTSGLTARYRADQISGVANGGLVPSWPDLSSFGYTATQASSGLQPTFVTSLPTLGARAAVRFTKTTFQSLVSSAPAGDTAQTITAVIRTGTSVTGDYTIRGSQTSGAVQFRISNGLLGLISQNVQDIGFSTTTLAPNTSYAVAMTYNSTTGAYAFQVNGVSAGGGTNAVSLPAGTSTLGINASNNGDFFDGWIAELNVHNRVLTAIELTQVYAYYHNLYGV